MYVMSSFSLLEVIGAYGYVAIFVVIALSTLGIPLPGQTILTIAAASTVLLDRLDISLLIIVAATAAAVGSALGFLSGRYFGSTVLLRYGRFYGFDEHILKAGQRLFQLHGGKIIFFGRFSAPVRTYMGLAAGANHFSTTRFLIFNACGSVVWAMVFGLGGYAFGHMVDRIGAVTNLVFFAAIIGAIGIAFWVYIGRQLSYIFERDP